MEFLWWRWICCVMKSSWQQRDFSVDPYIIQIEYKIKNSHHQVIIKRVEINELKINSNFIWIIWFNGKNCTDDKSVFHMFGSDNRKTFFFRELRLLDMIINLKLCEMVYDWLNWKIHWPTRHLFFIQIFSRFVDLFSCSYNVFGVLMRIPLLFEEEKKKFQKMEY